jgi:hypothetical protein
MIPCAIKDPLRGTTAYVTKYGQLVVAPLDYSVPVSQTLDVISTAFNYIEPMQSHQIVITDIIGSTDRTVGVNGVTVDIYQASGIDETAIDESILKLDLPKQTEFGYTGLNFIIPEGEWVNAKVDDVNVLLTIAYYRVPSENI